jgi:hypothetical protein
MLLIFYVKRIYLYIIRFAHTSIRNYWVYCRVLLCILQTAASESQNNTASAKNYVDLFYVNFLVLCTAKFITKFVERLWKMIPKN